MALYIDSAFLNDIMNVSQTVPLAGVTTNPTILLAARERIKVKEGQGETSGIVQFTPRLI